jgi:hypothetical protein
MTDNVVVSTLAPEKTQDVPKARPAAALNTPLNTERQALFDSIASEGIESESDTQSSPLKTVFTGLLWFGYTVAIVVALVLVWSAASGLLKSIPR